MKSSVFSGSATQGSPVYARRVVGEEVKYLTSHDVTWKARIHELEMFMGGKGVSYAWR